MKNRVLFKGKKGYVPLMILSVSLVGFLIILTVCIGQVHIPFIESYKILVHNLSKGRFLADNQLSSGAFHDIIMEIRAPRILLAVVVGTGLSIAGNVMQASVQNPLADPYILGTSSGASLGATAAIMLGFGRVHGFAWLAQLGVPVCAFLGALFASIMVLAIANSGGKATTTKLVLGGTVINMVFGTITSLITYLFPNAEGMKAAGFWSMGGLTSARWGQLPLLYILVFVTIILVFTQSRIMNIMLIGEEAAQTLGININRYRTFFMILSSFLTGIVVSSCGIVGFVGLIIPHVARAVVGANHKRLIPFSAVLGAIFLLVVDTVARTVRPGSEIPIGLITSLIGAPMFMYMIITKGNSFGG
ncbi:iron ABC transporter permease [Lachnospiraceae bacterium ZAX-1]